MSLIVGIDLGTTHCALAWVDPAQGAGAPVHDFSVLQLVRVGELAARPLLDSCVYLPGPHELPPGSLSLPWSTTPPDHAVGELARWQGARVPGRLIASAKSWLCHPGVDRQAPILPWGAPAEVEKRSPVAASALLLEHLARAWNTARPSAPLAAQEVVITVPASFDEAARALTVSAARQAGLERFRLLEEPQAAFYDFTGAHRTDLAQALAGVRLVLVVDVGGGTTDFTLVQVEALPEGPAMRRIAVGDHLMLGGDNMDAALARRVEEKWAQNGQRLSAAQWTQLLQGARQAKEALLGTAPPDRFGISVVSSGSKLFGGTLTSELTREETIALVREGFFPAVSPDELPRRGARGAIQELGLPYAQDPAVTRHLAAFLRAHASAAFQALGSSPGVPNLPRPDALLLNGGVFNSKVLSEALRASVSALWPEAPPVPFLAHGSLDLAVARGAAYYGLSRRGLGRRISGGAARAYYVRLAADSAVCLIPRGFEEGESVSLAEPSFTLTLGRPVQVQLLSTSADRIDAPGVVISVEGDAFVPLPPIHTVLRSADPAARSISVRLTASLTEIGTLELSCVADQSAERWRLEFEVRGGTASRGVTVTESMPARFAEATELVQRVFGHKPLPVGPKDVKNLVRALEKVLGPKETWRLPVLRELWTALFAGAGKRRRSPDHERVFFHLLGYSLRPGFGYPLDDWRSAETFRLFREQVQHHGDKAVWIEFWVLWRRLAGGLEEKAQRELWTYLRPHLLRRIGPEALRPKEKLKGVVPEGTEEMVRAAAALEHLEPADKQDLGSWVLAKLQEPTTQGGPWAWALGRLGARAPLYGSGHRAVPVEVATEWAEALIALEPRKVDGASFALAQLARLTGDRTRDLDAQLRRKAESALVAANAPEAWRQLTREVVALSVADGARALGDTLPAGLQLGNA